MYRYAPLGLSAPLLLFLRVTSAWRLAHAYGVFPHEMNPNLRQIPLFQAPPPPHTHTLIHTHTHTHLYIQKLPTLTPIT